jgi:hypothetical protein
VVVLSKEFISKRYPMEELQLLLHWQRQGSSAVLLPVLYDMSYEELGAQITLYKQAATGKVKPLKDLWAKQHWSKDLPTQQQLMQWVEDLGKVAGITGFQEKQVGYWFLATHHSEGSLLMVHTYVHCCVLLCWGNSFALCVLIGK